MFFKKQRSNDFVIGRLCLFPNSNITLNNYEHLEYVHWIYVLNGSVRLDYIVEGSDPVEYNADTLIDLRNFKENHVNIIAGDSGFVGITFMTELLDDDTSNECLIKEFDCEVSKSNNFNIPPTSHTKIIIPLVTDLKIKTPNLPKYRTILPSSAATLNGNTSAILTSNLTSVSNYALLFTKLS